MPRKNRKEEIHAAIKEYLKTAVNGLEPITDELLMAASECARATFYKYVTKGSAIEAEINNARKKQNEYVQLLDDSEPSVNKEQSNKNLRMALAVAIEGNRNLIGYHTRVISNLIDYGVPISTIQKAERDSMSKPDRSVSHAGSSRGKAPRRR